MTYNERIVLAEHKLVQDESFLPASKTMLKETRTVFTYDNGVSYLIDHLATGVNHYSGKRWYRWVNIGYYRFTIKTLKNGKNYLFLYNGKTKYEMPYPHSYVINDVFLDKYVFPLCEKLIEPCPVHVESTVDKFFYYAKPSLVGKSIFDASLARQLKVSFRLDSVQKITLKLFGKERYRKDLVKAVASAESYNLVSAASTLAKETDIPTDWFVELLKNENLLGYDINSFNFLRLVPHNHWRKFFLADDSHVIPDIQRLALRFNAENTDWTGSLQSIHDRLMVHENNQARIRVINREKRLSEPFEYSEEILEKATQLRNNHQIILAENAKTLVEWSSSMNNCISGYDYEARAGKCYLLGYYDGDRLIANMEVNSSGRLNQLLGKYNRPLEPDLFYKITKSLEECEFLTSTDFTYTQGAPAAERPQLVNIPF